MREFGAELLNGAGAAVAGQVRARHRDYYLGLAERAAAGSMTAGQTAWLTRLGAETANLRVALDFCFGTPGEAAAGLRMTRRLLPYWLMTGQFTEGRRWHDLALPAASAVTATTPGRCSARACSRCSKATSRPAARCSPGRRPWPRPAADEDLAAHVTDARGMLAFYSGDLATAQAEFEAALAVDERAGFGDPTALVTYSRLASVCLLTFELDRAVGLCEECLRRCDETR